MFLSNSPYNSLHHALRNEFDLFLHALSVEDADAEEKIAGNIIGLLEQLRNSLEAVGLERDIIYRQDEGYMLRIEENKGR